MRRILPLLLVGFLLVLPLLVSAQLPDRLVPCDGAAGQGLTECQVCHAVELGQNIINFLVAVASFLAVVIFAWAGFLMLTAAGDTGKVSKAHSMFWNVLIGLIIVLSGWLIIDTVMKWAFQGTTEGEKGSPLYEAMKSEFGPWNQIKCAVLPTYTAPPPGTGQPGVTPGGGGTPAGAGGVCRSGTGCSPEALKATGLFTDAQAKVMSCIAQAESTANPNAVNDKPDKHGRISNACGYFQILPSNWRRPALHKDPCSNLTSCTDIACNIQAAQLLADEAQRAGTSRYQPWICEGCDPHGTKAACLNI